MGLKVVAIASALPPDQLTNEQLKDEFLQFSPTGSEEFQRVVDKTGIRSRHVAPRSTTALDLAVTAASRLRELAPEEFSEVDYIIHCTQSPDHFLPTTACLLQARLSLGKDVGAIDVNLGCSGFVYCLSLADAMLRAGRSRAVLVTTADTYTHYVHPRDITNRIIFGDGAAATLLKACDATSESRFIHWTDGTSAKHLIVENGAARNRTSGIGLGTEKFVSPDPSYLYMNGFEVFRFGISQVPSLVAQFLGKYGMSADDYDGFVPHQANRYMLEELNKRVRFPSEKVFHFFDTVGNTVSASIPLAIESYLREGRISRGARLLLAGFGVGFSAAIGEVYL